MTARAHRISLDVLRDPTLSQPKRAHQIYLETLSIPQAPSRRVHQVHMDLLRPNIRTQPQKVHAIYLDVLRKRSVVESLLYGTPIHRLIPSRFPGRPPRWAPLYSVN